MNQVCTCAWQAGGPCPYHQGQHTGGQITTTSNASWMCAICKESWVGGSWNHTCKQQAAPTSQREAGFIYLSDELAKATAEIKELKAKLTAKPRRKVVCNQCAKDWVVQHRCGDFNSGKPTVIVE